MCGEGSHAVANAAPLLRETREGEARGSIEQAGRWPGFLEELRFAKTLGCEELSI